MSLDVGLAIREGLDRLVTPMGKRLLAAFLVIRLGSTVVSHTLTAANRAFIEQLPAGAPPIDIGPTATPFALPIPLAGALGLALVTALVAEAAHIAGIRFVTADDPVDVRLTDLTRRLGPATLHGFVGGIVVTVATIVGLLVFVLPGILIAVSFLFVRQEIAVRDVSVVDALADSWSLTSGNRIEVVLVLLVLFAVAVIASLPSLVLGALSPVLQAVVGIVLSTFTTVFGLAVVSRAYAQLHAVRAERMAID